MTSITADHRLSRCAFLAAMLTLFVCTADAAAGPSCSSFGGTCATSCTSSNALYTTSDCYTVSASTRCCVPLVDGGVGDSAYTHANAVTVMNAATANLCTSRTLTTCRSLAAIHVTLANTVATVFPSCLVTITQGTELRANTVGVAGYCGGMSGRRVAFTVSSVCGTNGISRMQQQYDATSGCYLYNGVTFCQSNGFAQTDAWTAWFCSVGGATPALWGDVLSSPMISWGTAAALDNAALAAQGNTVTTPSGRIVTLDGRIALTLLQTARTTGVTAAELSSGTQPARSRHNDGRAVTVSTGGTVAASLCTNFNCRKPQATQTALTEISWQTPPTSSSASAITVTNCDNYQINYEDIFGGDTLQCFQNVNYDYYTDVSDYCSYYVSPAFWTAMFNCIRLTERAWNCFWKPTYSTACNYWFNNGFVDDANYEVCGGVSLKDMIVAMCQGFANSAGVIYIKSSMVETSGLRAQNTLAALLADVAGSSNEAITWTSTGTNTVEGRTVDGNSAAAADDVASSVTVFESHGIVSAEVQYPTGDDSSAGATQNAKLSGGVVLGILLVVGGAISLSMIAVFALPAVHARYDRISHWFAGYGRVICLCLALGFLTIAAAGANWAQTKPSTSASKTYSTQSTLGVCACTGVEHGCPGTGASALHAAAAFTVIYMVLLAASLVLLVVHVFDLVPDMVRGFFNRLSTYAMEMLVLFLLAASAGSSLISFAIFIASRSKCQSSSSIVGVNLDKLGPGVILRIIEFVILSVVVCASLLCLLLRSRELMNAKRQLVIVSVVGFMSLASSSSASWSISMATTHLSPFTMCRCRPWNCGTSLGSHTAFVALMWIALTLLALFIAFNVFWESELFVYFVEPIRCRLPQSFLIHWDRYTMPRRWRVAIGLCMLLGACVSLGISLIIGLSVLIQSECRMGTMMTSYGIVFAVLAFFGIALVGVMDVLLVVNKKKSLTPHTTYCTRNREPNTTNTTTTTSLPAPTEGGPVVRVDGTVDGTVVVPSCFVDEDDDDP